MKKEYINFFLFLLIVGIIGSIMHIVKINSQRELISAQRTLIDSQREYISTADELIELQNHRIETKNDLIMGCKIWRD